jgi:hypothetical protein
MPKSKASHVENNTDSSKDIAALAYFLWMDRGCPEGSPDEDWYQAEALATTSHPSHTRFKDA